MQCLAHKNKKARNVLFSKMWLSFIPTLIADSGGISYENTHKNLINLGNFHFWFHFGDLTRVCSKHVCNMHHSSYKLDNLGFSLFDVSNKTWSWLFQMLSIFIVWQNHPALISKQYLFAEKSRNPTPISSFKNQCELQIILTLCINNWVT